MVASRKTMSSEQRNGRRFPSWGIPQKSSRRKHRPSRRQVHRTVVPRATQVVTETIIHRPGILAQAFSFFRSIGRRGHSQ